jgi:hypothetical protein
MQLQPQRIERTPLQGVPAICAIHPASRHRRSAGEADGGSVNVVVATAEGILYEYAVDSLISNHSPTCALEQECFLLRNAMES